MELDEGKRQFIGSWGQLSINWGTNKTMGQVHALLLLSPDPICADEIMEELKVSRGNVNANCRSLIDWGLVYKKFKPGERKEYFIAEKDVTQILKAVISQRKKKELDPMLKILDEIKSVQGNCEASNEFCKIISGLHTFTHNADKALSSLIETDSKWIMGALMRFMR